MEENDQRVYKDLIKKRAVVKAALTRVRTFVSNFNSREQAISLLEFRQEELPVINRKFDDIQSQIELLVVDLVEAEAERDKFEQEYFALRSEIQEIISQEKSHNLSGVNTSLATTHFQRTQLAPIPLPRFNGDIQNWSSFYDIFKAMVHNDESYTAAQKFFYLRSCLEGSALDLIRSIPVSDGNYDTVISQLIQRYDNRSMVIQSHIRSILECPSVDDSIPNSLQTLYSTVCTHIAALKSLGQPVEHWDAWLITIITGRLDKSTAHGWQLHQKNTNLPKYDDLESFLASRCVAIESFEYREKGTGRGNGDIHHKVINSNKVHGTTVSSKKVLFSTSRKSEQPCPCCSEMHRLYLCPKFKDLSVTERLSMIRDSRLCFNCLAPFHSAEDCRSKYTCHKCKQKHNTLLHYEKLATTINPSIQRRDDDYTPTTSEQQQPNNLALTAHGACKHVFLATASVLILDNRGNYRQCRAILDSGSQINFISNKFANLLQLPRRKRTLPVSGIGANRIESVSSVSLKIQSRLKHYQVNLDCQILPILIDDFPRCAKPRKGWNIPPQLIPRLADPSFDTAKSVDLLIGGGIFFDLLDPDRISLHTGTISLQDTKFGWVITGEVGATCLLALSSIGEQLENEYRAMYKDKLTINESVSKSNKKVIEESEALKHYEETAKRDETGRFILRLPLKSEVGELGKTLEMATSRFLSVERRLQKDESLKLEYTKFMDEYLQMGHMEKVTEKLENLKGVFYLPHHPVIKLSSLTTKLRVVFDASARSSSRLSLNDVLMSGPTVQDDLVSILMRFRKHQFVITADIEKMFRQIMVAKEDQNLQRIVWRSQPDQALESYRLTTVTYGTTSASFMATNCLALLSKENKKGYPEASKIIRNDFYMDDLMTGADTIERCCILQQQISAILETAKLPLRKWCSNSSEILSHIGRSNKDPLFALQIGEDDIVKSLGLGWKPTMDEFRFIVESDPIRIRSTKRMLLSDLNRIFDPLGFLAPVLIRGKIFLQQLWQLKIEWDQPLSEDLMKRWQQFYQELKSLSSLSIPRKCIPHLSSKVEIHGFCDASEEAYGAAIYIRSIDHEGNWHSELLCAKTRVAPLKGATIPRLELNGALTLAKLAKKTADAWELKGTEIKLWTDSMVVLSWINNQSCRLKTYVANRVEQILEITESQQWRHVRTDENPADILSRGISPSELQGKELWWHGPNWFKSKEDEWKQDMKSWTSGVELPEQRTVKFVLGAIRDESKDFINIYSKWNKLRRAISWMRKFVDYLKSKRSKPDRCYLTVDDLQRADHILLKRVQVESFEYEVNTLIKGKELSRRSKLISLQPLLKNGLILVGGRLKNAGIQNSQKEPVILPSDHKITRMIFEDTHCTLLHCGAQSLLAEVRRRYWPIKGRMIARSVIRRCVICIKAKPTFQIPTMAHLPKERVQATHPFTNTGVDFAGPIIIRSGIRGRSNKKVWIALFVCFSIKAIHMEVVEDMTSTGFLAALRRFTSRRGKPKAMWSDNGTNFVGAQRELSTCLMNAATQVANEGITWHFNPPSAPHFGGLWESGVKCAKHHLTRVLKEGSLTYGELETLLCQVEACLNSRPLTPLSSDPLDLDPLTPAHFLIGGPTYFHPEPDLLEEEPNTLRKWSAVQYMMQTFWKRWYLEYLPQLQVRGKWTSSCKMLEINDLVIVKEDNMPPAKWKMARITKTHPGCDGKIRVVTIRLANGNEIKRPVIKLCRLPVEENTSNKDSQPTEEDKEIVEAL